MNPVAPVTNTRMSRVSDRWVETKLVLVRYCSKVVIASWYNANRMNGSLAHENRLGTYLRDRRTKLDPTALGFPPERRRTLGLRREEVAQRANISPTWYTWLEQGRGGAPSADVLDRISRALMLTDLEREHLFLVAL